MLLHRFPFSVVYAVEANLVLVIAIAHHGRRPGYWTQRLSDRDEQWHLSLSGGALNLPNLQTNDCPPSQPANSLGLSCPVATADFLRVLTQSPRGWDFSFLCKAMRDPKHKMFSDAVVERLDSAKILGVRAGMQHRYTGVWPVVVEGRLFCSLVERQAGGMVSGLQTRTRRERPGRGARTPGTRQAHTQRPHT